MSAAHVSSDDGLGSAGLARKNLRADGELQPDFTSFDALDAVSRRIASGDESDEFEVPKSQIKKRKRKEKRRSHMFPTFDVNVSAIKDKISVADLRDLVLWILADGVAPKWLSIYNKLAISHVAVVLVPGLTSDMFGVPLATLQPVPMSDIASKLPAELTFFKDNFPHLWPTKAPGDKVKLFSPTTAFMNAPLPKSEKAAMRNGVSNGKGGQEDSTRSANVPLSALIMSAKDFVEGDYPIHSSTVVPDNESTELPAGWVETVRRPERSSVTKGSIIVQDKYRVYGLDCEMCLTTHGSELARVTVVDWNREVVMDELVKPEHMITDYLTRYSGITAKLLANVETKITDVQKRLVSLIDADDILVGHSLDNDLKALKLRHPNVIDTSVIYHHARGLPSKPSLKWLAQRFLKKDIQQTANGHDSAEDARTCIDLVKLKVERGLEFGTAVAVTEPILRRIRRFAAESSGGSEGGQRTGKGAVVEYGNPVQWHGSDASTIVSCKNDDEVAAGVVDCVGRHDLVWARLRELEFNRGWVQSHGQSPDSAKNTEAEEAAEDSELRRCLEGLNARLVKIWNALPPATAVVVMSGSGDPREMSRLNAQRIQFKEEYKTKKWDDLTVQWTDADNQLLLAATEVSRAGVSFLTIKGEN